MMVKSVFVCVCVFFKNVYGLLEGIGMGKVRWKEDKWKGERQGRKATEREKE